MQLLRWLHRNMRPGSLWRIVTDFRAFCRLADNAYSSDDTTTSEPVRKTQRMLSHAEHRCGVRDDTAAVKDESDSVKSECATPAVSSPLPSPSAAPSYNKYCHFCQHVKVKRTSSMFGCSNQECQRRYCEYCLRIHLKDPVHTDAGSSAGWLCPHCRASCCCSTLVCDKPHRHCKAYRYRLLRAQQAAQRSANAAAAKPVLATVRKGASPKKVVKSDECSVGPAGVLPEEERSCGLAGDMSTAAPSPEPRSQ
jgi:hypothetical protein